MNENDSEPLVAKSLDDLAWFRRVVEGVKEDLAATPNGFKPLWLQRELERNAGALHVRHPRNESEVVS